MKFSFRKKRIKREIYPDEIFLDSKNLPNFNTQQFEGRIEKSISKKTITSVGIFFIVIVLIFTGKTIHLQIVKGDAYFERSENNTLMKEPIIAFRGTIKDRNEVLLAWNTWGIEDVNKFNLPERTYTHLNGFGILLGYVSRPQKDKLGYYWQDTFIGKDGTERFYNDKLTGVNGVRIFEKDVKGNIHSENTVSLPKAGEDVVLSIDSRIQEKLYDSISKMAENSNFTGGSGIIMDIYSGEIISIVNYPEYNNNVVSNGKDSKTITSYLNDKRKLFLNRAVSGLYAPGSIVKPFVGYGALKEKVITPTKKILANGTISIPNPYFPEQKSIFKDHDVFGYVDMRDSISVSSDIYFYVIGGGFEDQKGMGIGSIDKYSKMFGIGEKTGVDVVGEIEGVIPTPEWKKRVFDGDIWRIGDTYNTSIGQYGFQTTPLQMTRATAGLANMSFLPTPHITLNNEAYELKKEFLDIDKEDMRVIHEGMRMAVTEGTCKALDTSEIEIAAKSGTAQVGYGNTNTNSWVVGFFPYENPRYSFTILMERGPKSASGNATRVMREIIDYMTLNTREYIE